LIPLHMEFDNMLILNQFLKISLLVLTSCKCLQYLEVDIRMDILGESQQYDKGNVKCKRKFLIQKCGFLP